MKLNQNKVWAYVAMAAIAFAVALAVLCGCATTKAGITKCPRCGWLVNPVDSKIFVRPDGTRDYVTEYYCWSSGCGWWGYLTNSVKGGGETNAKR